ncbi:MAG: glycosyltransferase [Thermomicrobiales bacterium]
MTSPDLAPGRGPRILLVGMADSIHLARWIAQFAGLGWDLHLFPERAATPHPNLAGVTVWDWAPVTRSDPGRDLLVRNPLTLRDRTLTAAGRPPSRAAVLAGLIQKLRPDVLHTMEFQHAGYLAVDAWDRLTMEPKPAWIASNYGSDIHLFGRLSEHRPQIRALLERADIHHCECARDLAHGHTHGFAGADAELVPMGGGWDLDAVSVFRQPGRVSRRKTIALKAYEGWAGRAGVALEALRRCADLLPAYTLELYRCDDDMLARAQILSKETGIAVRRQSTLYAEATYEDILALHGRARISIGLSISDAISTSLLEAMLMGSFPVQSNTGCCDEWITSGVNGILTPAEDPAAVAVAIRKALTDDLLVDRAAAINAEVARERLAYPIVRERAVGIYDLARSLRNGAEEVEGRRRCAS